MTKIHLYSSILTRPACRSYSSLLLRATKSLEEELQDTWSTPEARRVCGRTRCTEQSNQRHGTETGRLHHCACAYSGETKHDRPRGAPHASEDTDKPNDSGEGKVKATDIASDMRAGYWRCQTQERREMVSCTLINGTLFAGPR